MSRHSRRKRGSKGDDIYECAGDRTIPEARARPRPAPATGHAGTAPRPPHPVFTDPRERSRLARLEGKIVHVRDVDVYNVLFLHNLSLHLPRLVDTTQFSPVPSCTVPTKNIAML